MFAENLLNKNNLVVLNEYPDNLPNIDYKGFAEELNQLKKEAMANLGEDDIKHLQKMERWGRICTVAGYSTAWLIPNPISAFLISTGNYRYSKLLSQAN